MLLTCFGRKRRRPAPLSTGSSTVTTVRDETEQRLKSSPEGYSSPQKLGPKSDTKIPESASSSQNSRKETNILNTNTTTDNWTDPPEPYTPHHNPGPDTVPPTYNAYEPTPNISQPPFPETAITSALYLSRARPYGYGENPDALQLDKAKMEQEQYFSAIRYGDQLNRGLDELSRFQEDWIEEVAERKGVSTEEIGRRTMLSSWDGDREEVWVK